MNDEDTEQTTENQIVELFVDGKGFFAELLAEIRQANRFIAIEIYWIESGIVTNQMIGGLLSAVERGVEVELLIDGIGSRKLNIYDRNRLIEGGITLTIYNPLRQKHFRHFILRDHRKLFSIDHSIAFIGGFGIADPFFCGEGCWHDIAVKMRGPIATEIAQVIQDTGRSSISANTGETTNCIANSGEARSRHSQQEHAPRVVTKPLQLLLNEGFGKQNIKRAILNQMSRARQRIWITTAYFYPSMKLRRTLKHAAARGVDVRLLVPGRGVDHWNLWWAGRFYYKRLLQQGVSIYEYQTAFIHSKYLICDQWLTMGSSNFDRWNQRWNLEANIATEDQLLLKKLEEQFLIDLSNSIKIDYPQWFNRSYAYRILERWGHFVMLNTERLLKSIFLRFRR